MKVVICEFVATEIPKWNQDECNLGVDRISNTHMLAILFYPPQM